MSRCRIEVDDLVRGGADHGRSMVASAAKGTRHENAATRPPPRWDRRAGLEPDRRRAGERRQEPGERHHAEHGLRPQELQPAAADQQEQRQAPGARLEHQPDERHGRAGGADHLQRRHVCDQRQVELRDRRRDRTADLAHAGAVRARPPTRGRHHPGRRDDLQRQAVPRHLRQPRAGTRHEDRQGAVEPEVRRRQGGLLRHQRADCRQRRAADRDGGRRVDDPRIHRRLGPRHRQEAVAPPHDSGTRRTRLGDVAEEQRRVEVRRRADVAFGLLRSGARPCLLGHRQCRALRSAATRRPRQPVHVERAGDPAEDRRDRVSLPIHTQRRLRRGRRRRARARRYPGQRPDPQGDDPAEQERLPLRAGPDQLHS